MRLYACIVKTLKENLRDWKVLAMVLLMSPFFLLIVKMFYGGGPVTYNLGLYNADKGKQAIELISKLENIQYDDGVKMFKLKNLNSLPQIEEQAKNKTIDIGVAIPDNYSKLISNGKETAVVNLYGSMSNTRYIVAAIMAADAVQKQGIEVSKINLPANIRETFVEKKQALNEFEGYVPGMIALSFLMLFFSATATIVKENDKHTLIRLKLSRLGVVNYLAGISIVQTILAVIAVIVAYLCAIGLGYKPVGSNLPAICVIGLISSLSMVALSLITASFLSTVFDVLTVGCFPFFVLMFFSGCMFPMPKVSNFTIAGHPVGVTDILPLAHTGSAFNKILNYGSGIGDILYEIIALIVLTVIYFSIGLCLYKKRKLSKA